MDAKKPELVETVGFDLMALWLSSGPSLRISVSYIAEFSYPTVFQK